MVFILFAASLPFWIKIFPAIKDRERSERSAGRYISWINVLKLSPRGVDMKAKADVTATVIFLGIFSAIGLLIFTVLFLFYTITNYIWLVSHFIKASRLMGAIFIIAGCGLLIRNAFVNKKASQRSFSKENITFSGLLIQNILFSMIAFMY
jgi:hypothetical protein